MRAKIRTYAQRWQAPSLFQRFARMQPQARSAFTLGCALLIVASTFLLASPTNASNVNVLANGSFEKGFTSQAGCGMVGAGWSCFTNGGAANYGFYDDQWNLTVADGGHSQLIEINTKGIQNGDSDRFAGIYQTVRVVDWANYTLSLRGMIRTTVPGGDPWRYRVQVGWTAGQAASWGAVTNWTDVGWDTYYDRTSPGGFHNFATHLMAEADYITIYIRAWKKWGVPEEEIDINFDAIALTGPSPDGYWAPAPQPQPQPQPQPVAPHPAPISGGVCSGNNLIANGGFEQGFNALAVGHVGKNWGAFTNGGAANYGFYDEQWSRVIAEGGHGQLIEINAKGIVAPDHDRYAGLYQRLSWLEPGKTYELTIKGLLRGAGNEDDPYRFAVQWGWNPGDNIDWSHVTNWQNVDFGAIQSRTEPGAMATVTTRFTAPKSDLVLFIRGWKKWGVPEVEMDLNLDDISLRGCGAAVPPPPPPPTTCSGCNACNPCNACSYTVQPGDTLGWIAQNYGVTVEALMWANNIGDPNWIYVGQVLALPNCSAPAPAPVAPPVVYQPPPPAPAPAPPTKRTHVVSPGETFTYICNLYGTDPVALANVNGIYNLDLIYVGQVLVIP